MARLNNPHISDLSKKDFEKYPVWVWDDENEGFLPLKEPFTSEYGTLFIKAKFKTNDLVFDGYLIGMEKFYAFGLFIKDKEITININLPEFIEKSIREVQDLLECGPIKLFPLQYESSICIDGKPISGSIDL